MKKSRSKNDNNNLIETSTKYFYTLSDKDMLPKLKLYDTLCLKYFNLRNKISRLNSNTKDHFFDKELSYLLLQSMSISGLLDKELKRLQEIYMTTTYRNFIRQTQSFKNLLKTWDDTLQKLDFLLIELNQNKTINKQKQR